MKHAGAAALDILEPLVAKIRAHAALKEKGRGVFYRKGKAFLHFHEDPAGLFADVFDGPESWRLRVSEPAEQQALLAKIEDLLAGS
jgi:hypothetical protein